MDVSVNLVHETLSQTQLPSTLHRLVTRLHQTLHGSLLVDMVGKVLSNGSQRLARLHCFICLPDEQKEKKCQLYAWSCLEMQKNMFFSNHVFYAKKSVFYRKKQFFNVFFFFVFFFNYRKIFN